MWSSKDFNTSTLPPEGVKKVKIVIHQMVIKYASFDILEGPMSKLCDRREIAQKISMTSN